MEPPGLRIMPIRFRCVYCDQLLGIARRKAGTVVKCPNCAGQLIVPPEHAGDENAASLTAKEAGGSSRKSTPVKAAPAVSDAGGESGLLFERSDFDDLLRPAIERHKTVQPPLQVKAKADEEAPIDLAEDPEPFAPPAVAPAPVITTAPARPKPSGVLLTPVRIILLCVVLLLGLAFSFGGGILVGMLLGKEH